MMEIGKEEVLETILDIKLEEPNDAQSTFLPCGRCEATFSTQSALDNHWDISEDCGVTFQCFLCSYRTPSSVEFKKHQGDTHSFQELANSPPLEHQVIRASTYSDLAQSSSSPDMAKRSNRMQQPFVKAEQSEKKKRERAEYYRKWRAGIGDERRKKASKAALERRKKREEEEKTLAKKSTTAKENLMEKRKAQLKKKAMCMRRVRAKKKLEKAVVEAADKLQIDFEEVPPLEAPEIVQKLKEEQEKNLNHNAAPSN